MNRDEAPWGKKWRHGGAMPEVARLRLADEIESMAYWASGAKSVIPMAKVVCYAMAVLRGDNTDGPKETP